MWFKDRKQHRIPVLIPESGSQKIMNLQCYKFEIEGHSSREGEEAKFWSSWQGRPDAAGIRSSVEASSTLRKDLIEETVNKALRREST
jgi:hypothetical protein